MFVSESLEERILYLDLDEGGGDRDIEILV